MGLLDRISRLVRSNVNTLVKGAEDPEKILQQTLQDMQRDLIAMRQAVAHAIATQKRTERQYEQAGRTAQEWYNRAQLALQKGDDPLAREALERRQTYSQTVQTLEPQIAQQKEIVRQLKSNMSLLERKISEARTKKDMYIARARAAQSSVRLHEMLMSNSPGSTGAFEKMEARIMDLEAQAEVAGTLGADDVERQFAQLEGQGSIDAQLAEMKTKMIEGH
ncbi:PspA/IM30 family [Synechococcus sp. PCC 7335]|uniref:PspA/IM30 family protein n=1 Tax=Synechococcus sp. (strain ATCC 29403 / PCC 7335) TaxID=91464 RepID=UPI00017EE7B7|nr:PspA/IM30 family protein [Synechococcus sp. PCC 7335]EDX86638.1 PspA/IM30 family [Synechococcus sp. PCC 7335]